MTQGIENKDINGVHNTIEDQSCQETQEGIKTSILNVLYKDEFIPFGLSIKRILGGGFDPGSIVSDLEAGRKEFKYKNRFD